MQSPNYINKTVGTSDPYKRPIKYRTQSREYFSNYVTQQKGQGDHFHGQLRNSGNKMFALGFHKSVYTSIPLQNVEYWINYFPYEQSVYI